MLYSSKCLNLAEIDVNNFHTEILNPDYVEYFMYYTPPNVGIQLKFISTILTMKYLTLKSC